MTWANFYQKVAESVRTFPTTQAILLKPSIERLPLPIQRFDDPFLPLSKAIIGATRDKVGIYIFDFASYLALGAAGVVALERSIAYIDQEAMSILHGPFTGIHYGVLSDDRSFNITSLTVSSHADLDYYLNNPPHGAFLYNGEPITEGGIMNDNSLVLYHNNQPNIVIDIISSDDLLYDLGDTYLDSIKKCIT